MKNFLSMKNVYNKGFYSFRKRQLMEAKRCFEITVNSREYKRESKKMLIKIDINLGKFREVREKLNSGYLQDEVITNRFLAILDSIEYNYMSSITRYERVSMSTYRSNSMLRIANNYINLGDFEKARFVIENCVKDNKYEGLSSFSLILMDILEYNYEEAYSRLIYFDKDKLSDKLLYVYNNLKYLILYYLGKDPRGFDRNFINDYFRNVLYENDDERLLEHISYHNANDNVNSFMYFSNNVNLKDLLKEVRERIKGTNPNYHNFSANYRLVFDKPIGVNKDRFVNGLCVAVIPNTDKIITMFPEDYSEFFDRENLSHDENIRRKLSL